MLAKLAELSIEFSGIGLPLPFSVRKRAVNQLREVAKAVRMEDLPAPFLPTNTVILLGFCWVGAKEISRFLNSPKFVRMTRWISIAIAFKLTPIIISTLSHKVKSLLFVNHTVSHEPGNSRGAGVQATAHGDYGGISPTYYG